MGISEPLLHCSVASKLWDFLLAIFGVDWFTRSLVNAIFACCYEGCLWRGLSEMQLGLFVLGGLFGGS